MSALCARLNHAFECPGVFLREFREHLSVKGDMLLLQQVDERAVGEVIRTERRVNPHIPKTAEITFLLSAVRERVIARVQKRFPRPAVLLLICPNDSRSSWQGASFFVSGTGCLV